MGLKLPSCSRTSCLVIKYCGEEERANRHAKGRTRCAREKMRSGAAPHHFCALVRTHGMVELVFTRLVGEAAEGNHGEAAVLDLSELVPLEVLLVGALQGSSNAQA